MTRLLYALLLIPLALWELLTEHDGKPRDWRER
jgi:hypothetical protein